MMCVFWLLHRQPHPLSAPLLRPSCSLGHRSIEIRAMNSPTTASTWSSARKSHQRSKLHSRLIAQNCSRHPAFSNPHSDQQPSTSRQDSLLAKRLQLNEGSDDCRHFLAIAYFLIKVGMKRQDTELEKISANDTTDKGLISKIYKQLIHLNNKETQPNKKVDRRP